MDNCEKEANQRRRFDCGTRQLSVLTLQELFEEHNGLIRAFRTALEQTPTDEHLVVTRPDGPPVGQHKGQYNVLTTNEVAVLTIGDHFDHQDIVISRKHGGLHRIQEIYRAYDGLQYPVMFRQREDGYHFDLSKNAKPCD